MDKYQKEWEETLEWASNEMFAVTERLKRTGRMKSGLDGDSDDYNYIYDEVERRRVDIQTRAKRGD